MRWIALVLVLLLVGGCADKTQSDDGEHGDDQGADEGDHGDDLGHPGNDTGPQEGNKTENAPPTVMVAVNVTGTGPYVATFLINGTDPDGDVLSWSLDADGDNVTDSNGTGLPANATFEYAEAGVYKATVNVTDGTDHIVIRLNLTIEKAGPEQFVGSGTARAPCPQCRDVGANTGAGYRAGQSGVDSVFLEIPPEYIGQPFTASASGGDVDLAFRDACAGGGTGGGLVGEPFAGDGDPEGVVPEGTVCVLMWNYDAANTELTITIA